MRTHPTGEWLDSPHSCIAEFTPLDVGKTDVNTCADCVVLQVVEKVRLDQMTQDDMMKTMPKLMHSPKAEKEEEGLLSGFVLNFPLLEINRGHLYISHPPHFLQG